MFRIEELHNESYYTLNSMRDALKEISGVMVSDIIYDSVRKWYVFNVYTRLDSDTATDILSLVLPEVGCEICGKVDNVRYYNSAGKCNLVSWRAGHGSPIFHDRMICDTCSLSAMLDAVAGNMETSKKLTEYFESGIVNEH